MAVRVGSSFSCLSTALSSPSRTRNRFQFSLPRQRYSYLQQETPFLRYAKDRSCNFIRTILNSKGRSHNLNGVLFAVSEDRSQQQGGFESVDSEEENLHLNDEDFYSVNPDSEGISTVSGSIPDLDSSGGKPGFLSFYNRPYKIEQEEGIIGPLKKSPNNLLWFVGPAVLVASFVFPSLYLRRLLSAVFEDSLLTDFLILFFTEALFYCGVAVFVLLIDRLKRPSISSESPTPQLEQRISSVATLVLSLIIPMVTMGLVWPWTGPAASATLAPYLVGIIVQFAFEQYARYTKSPSWPVIPIIFQVYRLHQLNRAAQLVTALSFTVRGAEMTVHNMAINKSLGTLLNVLQCLGVICIWSLSNFLMRFFPSTSVSAQ